MSSLDQDGVEKAEIIGMIAELSRLLGMIPSDGSLAVEDPVTEESMELSDWFTEARNTLLRLSTQLDEALDLHFQ